METSEKAEPNPDFQIKRLVRLQPTWNLDQVLVWVLFRNPAATARASRLMGSEQQSWSDLERRLTSNRAGFPDNGLVSKYEPDFRQAEDVLLDRLKNGTLLGRRPSNLEALPVDPLIFHHATIWLQFLANGNREAVIYVGAPTELEVGTSGWCPPLQPDELLPADVRNKLVKPIFNAAAILELFPERPVDQRTSTGATENRSQLSAERHGARATVVIVRKLISDWKDRGAIPAERPTLDEVQATVMKERPSESRNAIRAAFREERNKHPEIKWRKTGPRPSKQIPPA